MAFTNLLALRNKTTQAETFLAVEINLDYVKAAVWTVENNQVKVIKTSEIVALEGRSSEALLQSVDMAIETATTDIVTEPNKVIYGLLEDWVDEEGITTEKKEILKYLCQKLELEAIGYVLVSEALITYLQKQQGTPPTAIFIRFNKDQLLISLVQLGKIFIQETVVRSDDLLGDVNEGLRRFKDVESLPPRIILYNSHIDFEDIKQQLMTVDWEKELPFLHTPKIESLDPSSTIKAIAISGGLEAARSLGFVIGEFADKEETMEKEEPIELPNGFVVGEQKQETIEEEIIEVHNQGVVKDETTDELKPKKTNLTVFFPKFKNKLGHFFSAIGKIKPKKIEKNEDATTEAEIETEKESIKDFSLPNFKNKKKLKIWLILASIILFLFALIGGGIWYYFNVPKAEITVYLYPKNIDKQVTIGLSKDIQNLDKNNLLVPIFEKDITVSGSETIPTTGIKKIGEKAKGKVLIYNKTSKTKTFEKGTVLVGSDKLRFELLDKVIVASSSSQTTGDGEQITYGKSEADIVAGDIGLEYNTSNNSVFSFKDYSSDQFSAKAVTSISGGTGSQKQVVDKQDLLTALNIVEKKLLEEGQQQLSIQVGNELLVIGDEISSEIADKNYDQEEGAEVSTLTVEATAKVTALMANKRDFDVIILSAINESVASDFSLAADGLQTKIDSIALDDDKYTAQISATAKLMPKVNFEEIKRNITGKYPNLVEDYFKSLPNFAKTRIVVNPSLPGFLATLPRRTDHIIVSVEEAK